MNRCFHDEPARCAKKRTLPGRSRRRAYTAALTGLLSFICCHQESTADEVSLPAKVQAQFISKAAAYDRAFGARAGARVTVLVLSKPAQAESVRAANFLKAALAGEAHIAGLPHEEIVVTFTSPEALATESKRRGADILYVTPGFDAELDAICLAVEPAGVMTVTAVHDYVKRCVVLGFDVVAGRPKLLVHLEHAKRSGVHFNSDLLRLAQVYR